jgi:hypothetical protein
MTALRITSRTNAIFVIRVGRIPEKKSGKISVATGAVYTFSQVK